jgi:hypothetical protein
MTYATTEMYGNVKRVGFRSFLFLSISSTLISFSVLFAPPGLPESHNTCSFRQRRDKGELAFFV